MAGISPGQVEHLWLALAPRHWPVPAAAFPAETALVGGAVRDGLLGRLAERVDLDLVVPGDAISLGRELARRFGGSCVVLDAERSIARLVVAGWTLDLAQRMGPDLETDLARRDYSVNAMALPLASPDRLLDPHGGLQDLGQRQLRAIAEGNLLEDPLRLLRGIRLASELEFGIEAQTWSWIVRHHQRLEAVAGERILAELDRLAGAPAGERGLALARQAGLLPPWSAAPLPPLLELCAEARAQHCGLTAAEPAQALPLARIALVLDDAALERLKASRRLQQRCRALRRWIAALAHCSEASHGHPEARQTHQPPDSAHPANAKPLSLQQLGEADRVAMHRQLGADLPALLLLLEIQEAQACMGRWRDPGDPLFHPGPPWDGSRLQRELGLAPGPTLGELLDHLMRERAFGRIPSQPNSAGHDQQVLSLARRWLADRGVPCG